MTPWEREFCTGVKAIIEAGHPLTEAQIKKLGRIHWDRVYLHEHRRG